MVRLLDRKRFVHMLGVAGLGLGLLASTTGAPSAMAQENQPPGIDRQPFQYEEDFLDLSDEELKQLLIQLLREKVGEDGPVPAFQDAEDGKDVVILRLQDGGDGLTPAVIEENRIEAYHEFTRRVFTSNNNVINVKSLFAMNCSKFETKLTL